MIRFYFYANPFQPGSASCASALAAALHAEGAEILTQRWLIDAENMSFAREAEPEEMPEDTRAAVALGGDGTLLRLAPMAAARGVSMLGVHTGHVGFLMSGRAGDEPEIARRLMAEDYATVSRPMLAVSALGQNYLALNDVSVTRGEHPGVMAVRVKANGEHVFTPHGDGVVVSTPLGATAYAMAAGGPIVHPDAGTLLLTPICAREMLARTVLLPADARVTLSVPKLPRDRAQLAVDGQTLVPLYGETDVQVTTSPVRARLIEFSPGAFFATLREKMILWNTLEDKGFSSAPENDHENQ